MSSTLKQYFPLIELVSKSQPADRKKLLQKFSKDRKFFDAVSEICLNVCQGNITLNKKCKCSINKYKKTVAEIAKKPKSAVKRRKLINQSGGFLPALIPIIAGEIIFHLLRQ